MGCERFHCAACAASLSGFGLFIVSLFSGNSALEQGVRANRRDVLSWIRSYLSAVAPLDRCAEMTEAVQTALIASGSAVVGGVLASIGSVILHRLEEAKAIRQIYREKLERIAELLQDTVEWFRIVTSTRTLDELASDGRCPEVRQAYTLACLYFPELRKPIGEYMNNLIRIHCMLVDIWQPDHPSTVGTQAVRHPEYMAFCDEVLVQRNQIEDLIGEIAARYNKQK